MDRLGVYIHIPFCAKKCPYCDFYSVRYNKDLVSLYVDALVRNFRAFRDKYGIHKATSVYFGGGTPLLLSPAQLDILLSALSECFEIDENAEITAEANPSMSDKTRLSEYRKTGINRISFGVQSFCDDELKSLGRTHTAEGAKRAIVNAFDAGFENISADIMLGILGQNEESLARTIDITGRLPLSHISAYMLKIEENTPYNCDEIKNALPDDDSVAELYLFACKELEERGFLQYEISNFAKERRQSRHNLLYWKSLDYVGFGAAAHSCFRGSRFAVPCDIGAYIEDIAQQEVITDDNPCTFSEYAMLRLRLCEGLSLHKAKERFSFDEEEILKKAEKFRRNNLLKIENGRIILTRQGFLVSNGIIADLIV